MQRNHVLDDCFAAWGVLSAEDVTIAFLLHIDLHSMFRALRVSDEHNCFALSGHFAALPQGFHLRLFVSL